MTDSRPTTIRPEVAAFVASVRTHLADLDDEVREELVGGLEADLSDQLDEGRGDAMDQPLGDPGQYAAELRAAAGLPASRRRVGALGNGLVAPSPASVEAWLDEARGAWTRLVSSERWTRQAWEIAVTLRPAWWLIRAWLAVTLLDRAVGPAEQFTLIPTLVVPGLGLLVLAAAVVGSVLIGLGRLWPRGGPDAPLTARLSLLALNVFAISVLAPFATSVDDGVPDYYGYAQATPVSPRQGLVNDGRAVRNVFAYDAAGQPLSGVQLVDQDGKPLDITPRGSAQGRGEGRTVGCPAYDATGPLFNVFPLQQRTQRHGTCLQIEPDTGLQTTPVPPLVSVLPVTPGASGAADTTDQPTEAPSGVPAESPEESPAASPVP